MKRLVLTILALVMVLGLAATAYAATAQDVYNDYASDRKLNGPYTMNELEAYLKDATVHQYGNQAVLTELDGLVTAILGVWKQNPSMTFDQAVKAATGSSSGKVRKKFPFTGFEMLLAFMGGAALIGGGVAIRRSAK